MCPFKTLFILFLLFGPLSLCASSMPLACEQLLELFNVDMTLMIVYFGAELLHSLCCVMYILDVEMCFKFIWTAVQKATLGGCLRYECGLCFRTAAAGIQLFVGFSQCTNCYDKSDSTSCSEITNRLPMQVSNVKFWRIKQMELWPGNEVEPRACNCYLSNKWTSVLKWKS